MHIPKSPYKITTPPRTLDPAAKSEFRPQPYVGHAHFWERALTTPDHPGGCRWLSDCCWLGAPLARAGLRQ
jgi:hypothetical protein